MTRQRHDLLHADAGRYDFNVAEFSAIFRERRAQVRP